MFKELEAWLTWRYVEMAPSTETALTQISGLTVKANYIDTAEHDRLLKIIDQQPWLTDLKRRVQHYGYRYDYKSRSVDPSMYLGPLPEWIAPLAKRLHKGGFISKVPDQVIINEYEPGQGIASHVDCIPCFGDTIISLTLGSACVMAFTNIKTGEEVPVLLEPRGLIVMQDAARYDWKHGIAARKSDVCEGQIIKRGRRVSLTFRSILNNT